MIAAAKSDFLPTLPRFSPWRPHYLCPAEPELLSCGSRAEGTCSGNGMGKNWSLPQNHCGLWATKKMNLISSLSKKCCCFFSAEFMDWIYKPAKMTLHWVYVSGKLCGKPSQCLPSKSMGFYKCVLKESWDDRRLRLIGAAIFISQCMIPINYQDGVTSTRITPALLQTSV